MKMYFQTLRMFQQINYHLQGVCIKELQVLSACKRTIYGFTVKVYKIVHFDAGST
jgi:hypothetical protein